MRNRKRRLRDKHRERRAGQSRSSRRGVLLLVVLSMLVLFMLIGTAFLMSSNQSRVAMKEAAKQNRHGNYATELLERALFQIVRDTDNPNSVIRYHSLLRDLYGTDGFQGVVYRTDTPDLTQLKGQLTRFAGAIADNTSTPFREDLGSTNGQFVDIYVGTKAYSPTVDFSTSYNGTANPLDLRHVLKLERNPYGQLQPYTLPLTKGYFNGCLLTITSGPAAGQSTRILEYEWLGEVNPAQPGTATAERMFRFRVMAFQRSDGQPLQVNTDTSAKGRAPEITDLAAQSFMVNGRAFSGTGVGYNALAATGQPRLSALELFPVTGGYIGAELALLPNAAYFNPLSTPVGAAPLTIPDPMGGPTPVLVDPFTMPLALAQMQSLNVPAVGSTPARFLYPNYVGSGGPNEGYDAADFQNMFLALQTVTPRSQGRVVHSDGTNPPVTLDVSDPLVLTDAKSFLRLDLEDLPIPSFHRPDLVNFWYHRLLKYLTTKSSPMNADDAARAILQPYVDDKWKPNTGLLPADAALISAIKRQAMMRPTREDHPHFDGSNLASVPPDLSSMSGLTLPTGAAVPSNIAIPFWEAVGPWDLDNDNDGVRDSNWVDLGDPIQQTEDGRRYKPLYAILCVDLDSRLNVNAHGLADDILPPNLDPTKANYFDPTHANAPWAGNLVHDPANGGPSATVTASTLQLARGLGYGPAEISLRPVFPAPLDIGPSYSPLYGNRDESAAGPIDSYAALLSGRLKLNGDVVNGRYGNDFNLSAALKAKNAAATSATNYEFDPIVTRGAGAEPAASMRWYTGEQAEPSLIAQLKLFDYPWSFWNAASGNTQRNYQSAFGTPPDLKGRYALGLDWAGQPVYEVARDINPSSISLKTELPFNLLAKSPYEIDLASAQRRDTWASTTNSFGSLANPDIAFSTSLAQPDDAPYSPTDLEKVLRGWDADSGTLPSRLWDVVNDFDPLKLMNYDPNRVEAVASAAFGTPTNQSTLLTAAQEIAGINRRLVTTDSFDLPVASQTMPAYVSDFGADGAPGRRNDPDPANRVLNAFGTDDFQRVIGVSRAQATITDLLRYRVWLEARRYEMNRQKLTEGAVDLLSATDYPTFMDQIKNRADFVMTSLPQVMYDLLAPEVIAGKRMDLNRPFGNGKDDNDDGVVDDPLEAGEPFLDVNGNGKMDFNGSGDALEPFIDLNGDKQYAGPGDTLWPQLGPTTAVPPGNGTLAEPITFDYTNGHAEPVHQIIQQSLGGAIKGGIRNLDAQGRQLYARQLYCLMLLLVDENYIAPWDEKDPQINKVLDITIANSYAQRLRAAIGPVPDPAPDVNQYDMRARAILLRKLTCRTIAQWAVNCVDMHDSDVIMTPFEYDENPWDGWGEWDDNWNRDPVNDNANFIKSTFLPLDGDPATNENDAWVLDWANKIAPVGAINDLPPSGGPKILKQIGVNPNQVISTTNPPIVTVPFNQTRGVVWGAERPELLITETLAWHDRRTEDRKADAQGKHDELHGTDMNNYVDVDMDQRLRPKGSLFVELYNPWSPDGQYPAELYTRLDSTTTQPYKPQTAGGVDLSRLSNLGVSEFYNATTNITDPNDGRLTDGISGFDTATNRITKRSPVWRLIVVDDWPRARNRDRARIGNGESQTGGNATSNGAQQFAGYSQRMGDAPPEVKVNLPLGVTVTGNNLPAYLKPMVGAPTIPGTVEGWDATQSLPYRAPDPDFEDVFNAGFFNAAGVFTRFDSGFNVGFTPMQVPQAGNNDFPNKFNVEYPYIEREFYFTTDNSPTITIRPGDPVIGTGWGEYVNNAANALNLTARPQSWDYSPTKFKLRVPDRYIKMSGVTNGPIDATNRTLRWARSQKFIPISLEQQKAANRPVLAPILPGRYAVIGTAGTRYQPDATRPLPTVPNNLSNPNIFTSPIGRPDFGNTKYTNDDDVLGSLRPNQERARRIELRPNTNPEVQQVIFGSNGGDPKDQIQMGSTYDPYSTEIGRDNELIRNDQNNPPTIDNLTVPDNNGKARFYQACVAIPVAGMSASDPPWGWAPREEQAAGQELDIAKKQKETHPTWATDPTLNVYAFDPTAANGEGGYKIDSGDIAYDKPFDVAPELMRTSTTPNYRTTHLQRLANPELPWNPLPGQYKDAFGTDLYRPSLPVNPYRTIDSSTVNLTSFNGTSSEEHNIGTTADQAAAEGKLRPWERGGGGAGGGPSELIAYVDGLRGDDRDPENTTHSARQAWASRSVERGFWARLSTSGWLPVPPGTPANAGAALQQRILWAQEPALVDLRKPRVTPAAGTLPPTAELLDLIAGRQMTMRLDEVPQGQTTPPDNTDFGAQMDNVYESQRIMRNHCDMVWKHSLGYGNESFGLLYDRDSLLHPTKPTRRLDFPNPGPKSSLPPLTSAIGAPAPSRFIFPYDVGPTGDVLTNPPPVTVNSTYPWLEWDNRPYVSADELLNVPAASAAKLTRQYSTIDPNASVHPNPYGLSSLGQQLPLPIVTAPTSNAVRWAVMQAPFGALANVFASSAVQVVTQQGTLYLPSVADIVRDATGVPLRFDPITGALVTGTTPGDIRPYGAPNFDRILEYVQVPSRYVGTDTLLNAETFNDAAPSTTFPTEPVGTDIADPSDPRYNFQPPFNKVSRERDPGRVNLNTVTGRRVAPTTATPAAQIWSEVYDGIMHRFHDQNLATPDQGHFGPAWRDVVLSRRGYAQIDAGGTLVDKPAFGSPPDTLEFGLNNNFPSIFSNPFRSPDAGDLVPLVQMMQFGADASMERVHPRNRGAIFDATTNLPIDYDSKFGNPNAPIFGDARDAGFSNDGVSIRTTFGTIPSDSLPPMPLKTAAPPPAPTQVLFHRDSVPLFAESRDQSFADTDRNPYMMYEPMSRLGNLVTNRSGVYAVWITVGYFEVEKAPDWSDTNVQLHFGNDINLYNRAYPDGYMLGKELGSETGDVKRPRGFYIIDRTEEVGFKPGEDLNVEKTIRLRRRIE